MQQLHVSRRRFLQLGAGAGAGALAVMPRLRGALGSPIRSGATSAVVRGERLTKFVEPLPVPGNGIVVATPSGPGSYAFNQVAIGRRLHPELPPTPVWAYDDGSGLEGQAGSFGMALVAHRGAPIDVSFTNLLPTTYPNWIPVDARLTESGREPRVLTHLHGGFVAAASDGNPELGPFGYGNHETQWVHYPNEQAPAMLWFHDHDDGATRLNVFAGLAAGYLLRDDLDTGEEPNPIGLPGGRYEIPIVIQDRQFAEDGTFAYPTSDIPGVTWIGEYFGDVMLVNGKVWPYLDVEPRLYRFRFLNGCNARILRLGLGAPCWQIGADGGLFDEPVRVKHLTLAPAERADVVVDFRAFAGQTLNLGNARPLHGVVTPAPNLRAVMQIRVGTTVGQPGPLAIPDSLPGRHAALVDPVTTRFITLNEIGAETDQWHLTINGLDFDDETVTETPAAGTVEDWVYVNLTGDTHPMHLHLVTFQVVGRTPFDADAYALEHAGANGVPGGVDPRPFATGPIQAPEPEERGFKDTVKANPGTFTTIRAKFDLPTGVRGSQTYVHHCHILEHEDNDMMRPFTVVAA
jgi:spore coat protein A, manganese oxidase